MTTATVFDWEDFPTEIKDYFEECVEMVVHNRNDTIMEFPLDWTVDDFMLDEDEEYHSPPYVDAYFEVVRYLKANMVAGTELAIVC